jgi:hypothetical protein
MPLYDFEHKETGEIITSMMSYSEMKEFVDECPEWKNVILAAPSLVTGVGDRTKSNDSGWTETMDKIAEAHPNSELAKRYGQRNSVRESRVSQAVEKWRAKRNKDKNK